MPFSTGFHHVATVTAGLDRVVAFYQTIFDARIALEMAATEDHPRMVILDLGAGSALNVTERPAGTVVGDRSSQAVAVRIDHYGIAVASREDLTEIRDRLVTAGTDVGEIQRLGDSWSLFFRDPDGMELEVCTPIDGDPLAR